MSYPGDALTHYARLNRHMVTLEINTANIVKHAPAGYINLANKICMNQFCNIVANYGKVGTKKAEYCKTHSPQDYINVRTKRCNDSSCDKLPSYGQVGTKLAEYCKTHAPSDYVNIKRRVAKPHTMVHLEPERWNTVKRMHWKGTLVFKKHALIQNAICPATAPIIVREIL